MSHGDHVATMPDGFTTIGQSDNAPCAAIASDRADRRSSSTPRSPTRRMGKRHPAQLPDRDLRLSSRPGRPARSSIDAIEQIRAQVGDGRVLLRAERRGRFVGRGGADPPGDRRAADPRLRQQRPAAARRGRSGPGRLRPRLRDEPVYVDATDAVPRAAEGRHRSRAEAEDRSARVHPRLRGRGGASSARSISWPRARSIPTSSRARPRTRRPRSRSRRTTTSAACRKTCGSSWSSRSSTCSRTRCARSAGNWACRTRSSSASRSPVRAWPSASSARSPPRDLELLRHADAIVRHEIEAGGCTDSLAVLRACCCRSIRSA